METYNFLPEPSGSKVVQGYEGTYVDKRNGIICHQPSMDLDCYYNYIVYLNQNRDKWRSYGYLDLGMMPVAMAPAINDFPEIIYKSMLIIMRKLKVDCFQMPAVSLFYERPSLKNRDLWVFREDLARAMKVPDGKITLEGFLKKVVGK